MVQVHIKYFRDVDAFFYRYTRIVGYYITGNTIIFAGG